MATLDPLPTAEVTQSLVHAEMAGPLAQWKRRTNIEKILIEVRDSLPYAARGRWGQLSDWQVRTLNAAKAAIQQLRDQATMEEIRTAADRAGDAIAREFGHHQACEKMASSVYLRGGCNEDDQEARQAVLKVLTALPVGSNEKRMTETRDAALAPFHQRIADRQARERDRANREVVVGHAAFPSDFPREDKARAIAAARKALDTLPQGASMEALAQARDRVFAPLLATHSQSKQKAELVNAGVREIFPYLLKLQSETRLGGTGTAWGLDGRITPVIRKRLEAELRGQEAPEEVAKRVRKMVREELDIAPKAVARA